MSHPHAVLEVAPGLRLEPSREDDGPLFHEVISRSRDFLRPAEPELADSTLDETVRNVKQMYQNILDGKTAGYKAMRATAIGYEMIGALNLFRIEDDTAGLGYWRDKNAAGKGYMTLSARRLVQYGFAPVPEGLDLQRIWLAIRATNAPSLRLARNIGAHYVAEPYKPLRQGEDMYEVVRS